MSDKDLLECCQAVLDFLCEDDSFEFPTPKQKIMYEVLTKNGWGHENGNMFGFTEYLNNLFQMDYQIKDESGNLSFHLNNQETFTDTLLENLN